MYNFNLSLSAKYDETMQFNLKMAKEEDRLKTFKSWIFDDTKACNASKLAEAGFYYVGNENEPDAVQCFLCGKSLDGWEEDDDPWREHINHSQSCEFAKMQKPVRKLTFAEYLKILEILGHNSIDKIMDKKKDAILIYGKVIEQRKNNPKN